MNFSADARTDGRVAQPASSSRRWSVRTFLLWLVLACLLPGVAGAAILLLHQYRERQSELERNTIQTARALVQAVDGYLLQAQVLGRLLATDDSLISGNLADFHARAREAIAAANVGTNAILMAESGQQLMNTKAAFGTPLPATPNPDLIRRVFITGKPAVSDLFMGPVLRRPLMGVIVPVLINGKVTYALGVGIAPEHFNDILNAQGLPPDWVVSVLDSAGTIVGRTHAPEQFVGQKATDALHQRMSASREGAMQTETRDGVPVLAVYSRSPITNWRVAIGIPHAALAGALARSFAMLAAGVAALFGIGLLLAWFIGGRIARSVTALNAPAMALVGNGAAPIPHIDVKEADEVASAIQRAADLLKAKDAELAEAHRLAKIGTWSWNLRTGEVTSSDSLAEVCGRAVPPFAEQRGTLLTIESWERINAAAQEARRTGQGYDLEIQINHGSGHTVWMNARCEAIRNEAGEVAFLRGVLQDVSDRKLSEQRVRDAARHDVLTGLPNRTHVLEYCERFLAAAQRSHSRGALLYIDLDRFKSINDLYGHAAGDRVLQEVGKRVVACTRQEDIVGRLGGDEFVVVLPHLENGRQSAAVVAQHIADGITRPIRFDSLELSVSPSIGISCFPEHANDVGTLMHTADLAMHQVKRTGQANCQFYTPALYQRAEEAFSIEARLRDALRQGGLQLHYQPVIDMKSGKLIGAEALVRLTDGDGAAIGPDRFIPIAEACGLIGELGEWVAAEACRQHMAWFRQGLELGMAINVSPLQFRQSGFAERLGGIISESGIDPANIEIEVTESAIMENIDETVDILNRIKSLGVKVALDDFGTGYSSLSSVTSLPLDKLKVDQSFVRRIDRDPASRSVAEAILSLGRSLKLDVHAEGIESDTALRYLRFHGCDHAQGYWFSRPLPAAQFMQWHHEEWSQSHVQARWRKAAGRAR